jgi:hypothetical protein
MPNPQVGSGPNVSFGMQKFAYVLYLAAAGSAATAPPGKLLATEPAAPWTRQGRLAGEDVTWSAAKPGFLEMRAGFTHALKARVVNQAEIPDLTLKFDEADPVVQALLRGSSYAVLSSGPYTGEEFIYKTGIVYLCKALIVGESMNSAREHHIYGANCMIVFYPETDASYEGLGAVLTFLDVSSTETFRVHEWD